MIRVKWELEDLYACSLGGFDVVCEIECDYEEPDHSVGYVGGPLMEGVTLIKVVEYDHEGEQIGEFSKAEFEDRDAMLCDYLEELAEDRCRNQESNAIFDEASEIEQGNEEYAAEMRYEARMESHDYFRDLR